MISRARSIACDSAEKTDALSGNLFTKNFPSVTAAAATLFRAIGEYLLVALVYISQLIVGRKVEFFGDVFDFVPVLNKV
jgi:hypothetical protein